MRNRPTLTVTFGLALATAAAALTTTFPANAQPVPAVRTAQAAPEVPAFRIVGPDGGSSLLLGTIYVSDARLRQPAMSIIEGAKRLVIEAEPDDPTGTAFGGLDEVADPAALANLIQTGQLGRANWTSQLTNEDLQLLRRYAECQATGNIAGQADKVLDLILSMKAWRVASNVAQPCPQANIASRSTLLMLRARNLGIPVIPLEAPKDGPRGMDRVAAAVGDAPFVASTRGAIRPAGRQAHDDIITAANTGNLDEIPQISRRFLPPSAADTLERIMVRERNTTWMPGLRQALQGGGAVVLLGAGSLPGTGGILDLLRRDGYRVEAVHVPAAPARQ